MTTEPDGTELFLVDFARLAREIAMQMFPVEEVIKAHQLTDEEWQNIANHPKFQSILADMVVEWNSASNVKARVKMKAATGLEMVLEEYITAVWDQTIPLTQRVEAGKFLARLGELDGQVIGGGQAGGGVTINIGMGPTMAPLQLEVAAPPITIEGEKVEEDA